MLLGKEQAVRLALACLLASGHLLIEDLPGMGKTTLAEALARAFGLEFKRVSFTSDLLPADLTGINVFDAGNASFHFQPGPLFNLQGLELEALAPSGGFAGEMVAYPLLCRGHTPATGSWRIDALGA